MAHIRKHLGEKLFKCQYPQCSSSFSCEVHLEDHQWVHSKEKNFECSIDLQKFDTESHLTGHNTIHESDKNVLKVESYQTNNPDILQRDTKLVHSDEMPFGCDQCPYRGKIKNDLNVHMRVHLGPLEKEKTKKYQCPHCPREFDYASNLKNHVRIHTGEKPFPCPHCAYKTTTAGSLNSHIAHRHVNKEDRKYKCEHCDYSAVKKQKMTIHVRKHTGEKPYKCQFPNCPYAATDSSYLRSHELTHGSEKPFKCDQCLFAAFQKKQLTSHRKKGCHLPLSTRKQRGRKRKDPKSKIVLV